MKTAVITIARGRHDHLRRQHEGLLSSTELPDSYIVVAMNDEELERWHPSGALQPLVTAISSADGRLPLAAARNLGAERAIAAGADLLVFLDVDCIPAPGLIERYRQAASDHPEALLNGAVGYLAAGAALQHPEAFASSAHFHPFRARLADGAIAAADYALFWSLSFACRAATWKNIGGFCEQYTGYGGEDTDFGQLARAAGVESLWVGGAEAFHQFHPTSDPPVEHLDDILANGELFNRRWGFWPMEGWLRHFELLGLVTHAPGTGGWHLAGACP
jgi:GT2 family glycosyltransferase